MFSHRFLHRIFQTPASSAFKLYCSSLWTVKCPHLPSPSPHRPFKFMKLYPTAHSAKLQCLFLSCRNATTLWEMWQFTPADQMRTQTTSFTLLSHLHITHVLVTFRGLGVGGWRTHRFPSALCPKSSPGLIFCKCVPWKTKWETKGSPRSPGNLSCSLPEKVTAMRLWRTCPLCEFPLLFSKSESCYGKRIKGPEGK